MPSSARLQEGGHASRAALRSPSPSCGTSATLCSRAPPSQLHLQSGLPCVHGCSGCFREFLRVLEVLSVLYCCPPLPVPPPRRPASARATLMTPLISSYVCPCFRKLRAAMRAFLFLSHFTIHFAEQNTEPRCVWRAVNLEPHRPQCRGDCSESHFCAMHQTAKQHSQAMRTTVRASVEPVSLHCT